jgi:hypothetical protein
MFIYAENNVGTSSTMTQEFRENHASKRFAHSPLLNGNDLSDVINHFQKLELIVGELM